MLTEAEWGKLLAAAVSAKLAKADAARKWREPGRRIPAEHVQSLAELTGIAEAKMRPDVFGKRKRAA